MSYFHYLFLYIVIGIFTSIPIIAIYLFFSKDFPCKIENIWPIYEIKIEIYYYSLQIILISYI